jgi:GT2 family glycosyltransferase
MRYCIVLVVYDPHDLYSRPCALPAALRSVESLRGEFRLEVTVNAASRCPGTVAFLRAWCAEREWAHLRVLRDNEGIAAAFNASVYSVLTDYDAFVFMSGDALLVDNAVLQTFSDAFERWQRVGALHPVSVFEDADDANYSTEWDIASFGRALRSWEGSSVSSLLDDPFSDGVGSLLQVCRSRPLRVTRPHLVLPLTFWAVRASVLLAVGPMDERWRFCYENMDFALRAYLAGAESAVVQKTFVFHRRVLFRLLGSMDTGDQQTGREMDGEALWRSKWGATPGGAFDRARYGAALAALLGIVRRVGGIDPPGWGAVAKLGRAALRRVGK